MTTQWHRQGDISQYIYFCVSKSYTFETTWERVHSEGFSSITTV